MQRLSLTNQDGSNLTFWRPVTAKIGLKITISFFFFIKKPNDFEHRPYKSLEVQLKKLKKFYAQNLLLAGTVHFWNNHNNT